MAGSLAHLVDEKRVLLCVGVGGVGKTTTAAALSVAAARRGKRVLCLTIDPARRLAQSLGLDWLSSEARSVDRATLDRVGVPAGGSLTIMRVDTKTTFDGLVTSLAPNAERRDRILGNTLYKYISTSLAGTQEYMAMEKLYAVRHDPRFDLVVLDTPPTTHALDFLDAPERLVGAIDSPAIKWFVDAMEGSGRFSFNLLAKGTAALLKGVSKVTGGGFLEQVAQFVAEINALFGNWKKRADEVSRALRGSDVGYVLVTTPDPLAIREVRFFADRLDKEGMRTDAFVVNRVAPSFDAAATAEGVADELSRRGLSPDLADRCLRALDDARLEGRRDALQLVAMEDLVERTHAIHVPTYAEDVYAVETLAEVGDVLVGPPPR